MKKIVLLVSLSLFLSCSSEDHNQDEVLQESKKVVNEIELASRNVTTIKIDDLMPNYGNDFTKALKEAIRLLDSTGGTIHLSPEGSGPYNGRYQAKSKIHISRSGTNPILISTPNGVKAEVKSTRTDWHVFSFVNSKNIKMEYIEIRGPGDWFAAGHGIRLENCENFTIENVDIWNSNNYGIGIQSGSQNSYNIRIRKVNINACGNDGIDVKGQNNTSGTEIYIEDCKVINPNKRKQNSQAGIDLRGKCLVKNTYIKVGEKTVGLRFRNQIDLGNGIGGSGLADQVTIVGTHNTVLGVQIEHGGTTLRNMVIRSTFSKSYCLDGATNKDSKVQLTNCKVGSTIITNEGKLLNEKGRVSGFTNVVYN